MKPFICNMPLKHKIQVIVLLCIALLSTAALTGLHFVTTAYDSVLYKTAASALSSSALKVQNNLNNLNSMADLFLSDNNIQNYLGIMKDTQNPQEANLAYRHVYHSLSEYCTNFRKDHIRYMNLYQGTVSIHTHVPAGSAVLPATIEQDLCERARKADGATIWITDYAEDYGLFMLKAIRRAEYLQLDTLGILLVCVDLNGLVTESSSPGFLQQQAQYLLYDNSLLMYHSPQIAEKALKQYQTLFPGHYNSLHIGNENSFYVKGQIPGFDWNYVCLIPFDNIRSSLNTSIRLVIIILILSVILSFTLSSWLIDSITRHFDRLLMKIRRFGDGQKEPLENDYDYENRKDELGILHRQFDHMVNEVNQLIQTNYLNEILIKEAQFKALENQMNPHFLYNTLESINWRAKILGAKDISAMAEALGSLLRITLDHRSKQVPLQKELELIQYYITIQKYRFEDRLNYQTDIPQNLLSCYVLKLTLQPLVENAIRYGLEENTEGCLISISAEACPEKDQLIIYVKNDGSAFEDDLLSKLENRQIEPHGFGIGLLNIQKRMQITYGEAYGLTLYNEEELAVAKLVYPLKPVILSPDAEASLTV